ncbi:glutamyl-tRNA reductase [Rhodoluna sp.]|uniref:glutamyl-tRNA reductase n=1 Tax=Rhodoluna sp. TaxID=1969481 RepID=UPI0025DDE3DC|nr:glutamyl-tRNA reductase [Rhodoluna sp.]
MALTLLATNYLELPLADLEVLDQHAGQIRDALLANKTISAAGAVVLNTCNRFEIYLDADAASAKPALTEISSATGLSVEYLSQVFKMSTDNLASQHLFAVSAGLESMVIGEEEIAGQVKRAFTTAQSHGQASTSLIRLFQKSASVSKAVTSKTGLGAVGRSIINVALDYLTERHGDLSAKKVLLFGTGAHARIVVSALQRLGISHIEVFSSSGRAQDFAGTRGLIAVAADDFDSAVARAQLIVACSGSQGHIIDAKSLAANSSKPLLIIDVALHADVSPEAANSPDVDFVNLDVIRRHAPAEHSEAILQAQQMVSDAATEFEQEQLQRNLDPFVSAIRGKLTLWIDEEVERVRLRDGEAAAEEIKLQLTAMANSMLHEPLTRAKALAATGDEENYRKALLVLFGDPRV